MKIDDQIEVQKLQYEINREAENISSLSWDKINKYKYLTSEEIFSSEQSRTIKQAKFTSSPLSEVFGKQTKTT